MRMISKSLWFTLTMSLTQFFTTPAFAASEPQQPDEVRGVYRAVLQHEGTNFYQFANITLRTSNSTGVMKISANVKVLFGEWDSNEYMSYDYDDVPLNILTRQLNMRTDGNDISLNGMLKGGVIEGDWFSNLVGRVGKFRAQKGGIPERPTNGVLVKTLSGFYRGSLLSTNELSNLPERITTSFVTTQDITPEGPKLRITGTVRFYLGQFDSQEYVETPLSDVQFNYFTRYLTAKTQDYGITFKGYMTQDGKFDGAAFSDAIGEIGKVAFTRN